MSICFLGDIHFRSDKDYFRKTCEEFLSWFDNWERNNKDNYLVLAGDLVESHVNGGVVIDYLERFYNSCRFKEVHICVGNHDFKKFNGFNQLAYEFFDRKKNIFIYKDICEVDIGGRSSLIMPYFAGTNDMGLSMNEYYSSIHKNKSFKNDYEFVVGHFCGDDVAYGGSFESVSNLDILSGRKIIGHIHTRYTNPELYIGSVFAGKKSENDFNRCSIILNDNGEWEEEKLPIFNEFIEAYYPNPLPTTKALVPIYTIMNCASEQVAKDSYGDIFIKRTTKDSSDISSSKKVLENTFSSMKDMSIKELYESFIKERGENYSIRVVELGRKVVNS